MPPKSLNLKISADALERLIAERAGVSPSHVAVRGNPPQWEAIALPKSEERAVRINIAAYELQQEYTLKE